MGKNRYTGVSMMLVATWLHSGLVAADEHLSEESLDLLIGLGLEELMSVEVYSAGKKTQNLSEVSSAVFVITQEEIQRAGVTSIPEALRLAPGVQVARAGAFRWAISIRGFNNVLANKLLVMIDGRSIYSPHFAGVIWEEHDTMLEDVDRIEVIRGPGATVWGANAVNGVINIITKQAEDTQGNLAVLGGGSEDRAIAKFRHGGQWGSDTFYRFYAQGIRRDESVNRNGDGTGNAWETLRAGFRVDMDKSDADQFTLQGEIHSGDLDVRRIEPTLELPYARLVEKTADMSGGHALFRWNHESDGGSQSTLQAYYDRVTRDNDSLALDTVNTIDLDFQQRLELGNSHDVLWGLGYRHVDIDTQGAFVLSFDPDDSSEELFSAFVQDEIELVPDELRLTLGSKFEHNDYTGFEYQPSLRLSWTPNDQWSAWSSVSRAVRTPSRFEHDVRVNLAVLPPNDLAPLPTALAYVGDDDVASERLIAYEFGLRNQVTPRFSWDFAAFYNEYDNINREPELGTPFLENGSNFVQPLVIASNQAARSWGAELSADWQARDNLRLQATYSFLDLDIITDPNLNGLFPPDTVEGQSPRHQAAVLASYQISPNLEWNTWLRYVDELPSIDIDSYVELDLQLRWQPSEDLAISLVGQNLLNSQHAEYSAEPNDVEAKEIERSFYGKIEWQF